MGIPQVVMIALMASNITIGLVNHGKSRTDKYNVWTNLIGCAIEAAILAAGGSSVKKKLTPIVSFQNFVERTFSARDIF